MEQLLSTLLSYGSTAIWLIILVISLFLEGITAGLITIWFAGGALVALVLSLIGTQLWIQITGFVVVSLILLFAARPMMSRWLKKNQSATNIDSVIGAEAKVVEDINNIEQTGAVALQGKTWTARNVDSKADSIPVGTIVKVKSIEGVKLLIEYNKDTEE